VWARQRPVSGEISQQRGNPLSSRTLTRPLLTATCVGLAMIWTTAAAWAGGGTQVDAAPKGREQSRVLGTPTLTKEQRATLARKDKAITTPRSRLATQSAAVTHKSLKLVRQQPQLRSYWCGPATLASLVQADKVEISQASAAKSLKTTTNGTDWYQGTSGGYPMQKALDRYAPEGIAFSPVNLPDGPTKAQKLAYKKRLVANISTYGQGIAGNAVEVPNGPHLNGHPNRTIYHWVAVRGYDDGGETTRYADSVAGSSISWAAPVPRYNEIDSDTIMRIFGARGYIW